MLRSYRDMYHNRNYRSRPRISQVYLLIWLRLHRIHRSIPHPVPRQRASQAHGG